MEANDDLWGRVYTPEEGVLLPINPGVKGQSRIFTKRRDDDGKHQSQKHKSGRKHNLWENKHGDMEDTDPHTLILKTNNWALVEAQASGEHYGQHVQRSDV